MSNKQVLENLSEKSLKALAASAGKFLKSQDMNLQHTKALDMVGVMFGFADWHGLQAEMARLEAVNATKPIKMSFDEFFATFKPVVHPYDASAGADGYAYETFGVDYALVKKAYEKNPGTVWTVVEGEGTMHLVSGLHFVNRQFYFITHKPAQTGRDYLIPYGHEEDDLCFEISALNPSTGATEVIDTRYTSSAEEALQEISLDYEEEIPGVVEAGQTRVIFVKQVPIS